MKEAASSPVRAKAMVDQKIRSFRWTPGSSAAGVKAVADPNRLQASAPMPRRASAASQRETAPTLLSHLPMFSPTRFSQVASPRPRSDAMTK